jgi:hypothetical protein
MRSVHKTKNFFFNNVNKKKNLINFKLPNPGSQELNRIPVPKTIRTTKYHHRSPKRKSMRQSYALLSPAPDAVWITQPGGWSLITPRL